MTELDHTSENTIFGDSLGEGDFERLMKCARGDYQRSLLEGSARWSGADLAGKARKYSGRYEQSRQALLKRIAAAGYDYFWRTLPRHPNGGGGRAVVVIEKKGQFA